MSASHVPEWYTKLRRIALQEVSALQRRGVFLDVDDAVQVAVTIAWYEVVRRVREGPDQNPYGLARIIMRRRLHNEFVLKSMAHSIGQRVPLEIELYDYDELIPNSDPGLQYSPWDEADDAITMSQVLQKALSKQHRASIVKMTRAQGYNHLERDRTVSRQADNQRRKRFIRRARKRMCRRFD